MKFILCIAYKKNGELEYADKKEFASLTELFDFLASQGHNTQEATLHSAATQPRVKYTKPDAQANFDIVYESYEDEDDECTVKLRTKGQCYYIYQVSAANGGNVTYQQFFQAHQTWARQQAASLPPRNVGSYTEPAIREPAARPVQSRVLAPDPEEQLLRENNFAIYECSVNEDGTINQSVVAQCTDAADCFEALHKRGHKVQEVDIYNGSHKTIRPNFTTKTSQKHLPIVYLGLESANAASALISKKPTAFAVQAQPGTKFYAIKNLEHPVSFQRFGGEFQTFCTTHAAKWSRTANFRKVFHPGNFLLLALSCVATGLILTAFFPPIGLAAAPFLAFFAVGFAAVATISGIGYAIHWLKREYEAYKTEEAANGREASFFSLNFLKHCFSELKTWAKDHPVQAGLMIFGAVLLLTALVVTAGYFIAPAAFGFMALGAAGGAIGLTTTSFFSAGFGIAASGGLLATLAATFAGATLIIGPTHLLDTIRRAISGFFNKDPRSQIEPQRPPREDYNNLDHRGGRRRPGQPRTLTLDPEQTYRPTEGTRVLAEDPEEEALVNAYGNSVFYQPTPQEIETFKTRTAVPLTQQQLEQRAAYQNLDQGDTLETDIDFGHNDNFEDWLEGGQDPVVNNVDNHNYDYLNPFATNNTPS